MLTFDTIRELERNERDLKKLQKLPDDLMEQLKEYLRRKEGKKEKTSAELLELENVKNTVRRFFEIREKKLTEMTLDCVKTGLPPENLTKEEEKTFYHIVDLLKGYREKFFEELQKDVLEKSAGMAKGELTKEEKEKPSVASEENKKEKQYMYKIKKTVPAFIGPDMKTYEFKEEQTIGLDELPKPLNDLLLKEGVIEKIEV